MPSCRWVIVQASSNPACRLDISAGSLCKRSAAPSFTRPSAGHESFVLSLCAMLSDCAPRSGPVSLNPWKASVAGIAMKSNPDRPLPSLKRSARQLLRWSSRPPSGA